MDSPADVAVVGLGCRFPGADNLDEFWRVLSKGENHVIDVPPDRWNVDAWYHPDDPGKTYARKVGIVHGHDEFDNRLYGISESESLKMDPQQRFVLDSVHMALEDGGFTREQLRGSKTAVFIGAMNSDYSNVSGDDNEQTDNYTLTGASKSILASRVSYVYDLRGPAAVVDSACSSALMAIHFASQAIRSGECDLAIAGGVNAIMVHNTMISLSKAGMISRSGQCQTFSEDADGYARGEGCGIVILKKLTDAEKSKDKIYATIVTGTNQDGHMAQPITAPSGDQQGQLLEDMYSLHLINKCTVQYIEAHGTGTPVGDPIEANCLGGFFGQDGKSRHIGSVKTNIGHLESAAGAAGLIKVLLMMKHETIVPSLFSSKLNPEIDFEKYHLKVPTDCVPWEELPSGGRAAGVNSFGFGGSNCHAYVKQYVKTDPPVPPKPQKNGYRMIAVSSRSSSGLKANILHLKDAAEKNPLDMDALSFTSTCRRDHHEYRLAFHARDQQELIANLEKKRLFEVSQPAKKLRVIYVFCGMGTAWKGMCIDLLDKEQVFRDQLEKIDELLEKFNSVSVINELRNQSNIHDPAVEPLVLFACQVGLTAVWRHWGVEADAVIGQSVGEVAAAHAAGILSLRSAVDVIYHRTQLLLQSVGGKMLVIINYPEEKVEEICNEQGGRVRVAVYNSPTSCTISGDDEAVDRVKEQISALGVPNIEFRDVSVKKAYHSHIQKPIVQTLVEKLDGLKTKQPKTDIFSTVTGALASRDDFRTRKYWARNVTDPVMFYQGIRSTVHEDKINIFLEVGPRPVLSVHFDNIFSTIRRNVVSITDGKTGITTLLEGLGKLYSLGINIQWSKVVHQTVTQLTVEPTYQFQRIKGLFEPESSRIIRQGIEITNGKHPFVTRVSGNLPTFEIQINEKDTPFVYGHTVAGAPLLPGSFFVETAFACAREIFETNTQEMRVSVRLLKPVVVSEDQARKLTLVTDAHSSQSASFRVFYKASVYAFAEVEKTQISSDTEPCDIAAVRLRCDFSMEKNDIYGTLKKFGFQYDEPLQLLTKCEANSEECLAWLEISDLVKSQMGKTHIHPSVLDAIMQSTCALYSSTKLEMGDRMPSILGEVKMYRNQTEASMCYCCLTSQSSGVSHFRVLLLTASGQVVAEMNDFAIKTLGVDQVSAEDVEYCLQWLPLPTTVVSETNNQNILLLYVGAEPVEMIKCIGTVNTMIPIQMRKDLGLYNLLPRSGQRLSIKDLSGIVFVLTPSSTTVEELTLTDFTESFIYLKELLCQLVQDHIHLAVTVVTLNTQAPPIPSQATQLEGSHLWGMMRSFAREDERRVQLIDLSDQSQVTNDILRNCISLFNVEKAVNTHFREILINEGKVYKLAVRSSRRVMPIRYKSASPENIQEPLRVMAHRTIAQRPSDVWLEHTPQDFQPKSEKGHVLVQVRNVVTLRDIPVLNQEGRKFFIDGSQAQHSLRCVEATGSLADDKEVLVFYPTTAATVISVPEECIIPSQHMEEYKPGLLTCFALMNSLTQPLLPDSHVAVVTQVHFNCFAQLVDAILKYNGCKHVEVYEQNVQMNIPQDTTHVVLFSDCPDELSFSLEHNVDVIEGFGVETTMLYRRWAKGVLPKHHTLCQLHTSLRHLSEMLSNPNIKQVLCTFTERNLQLFFSNVINIAEDETLCVRITGETLFRKNSAYVVVGGLSGLGWLIVQFIAEMGGGLVAIMSRRQSPDTEDKEKIRELSRQTGANIEFLQADVCNLNSLENAFMILKTKYPDYPVKGIFQGAGVLKDSLLINVTAEDFEEVSSPKVMGSLNLHNLSIKLCMTLEYFVLQSSVSSVFGSYGQTSYGAANSVLDTLAHYRRQKGLPGQSLNWGPLCVGMAVQDEAVVKNLKDAGFELMEKETIRQCFTTALLSKTTQVCFTEFQKERNKASLFGADDVRKALEESEKYNANINTATDEVDLSFIQNLDSKDRKDVVLTYVKHTVQKHLAFSTEILKSSSNLSSQGLNSMTATAIANVMKADTGIHIPATRLISEDITLEQLASEIENNLMTKGMVKQSMDTSAERVFAKLPKNISPLQLFVYRNHEKNYNNNDVLLVTELTLPVPLPALESALVNVVQRHQSLRTVYTHENGLKSEVLTTFDVPKVIPLKAEDTDEEWKEIKSVFKLPFNLSEELPLRIFHSNESQHRFWFFFHPITFDQKAVNIFFKELKDALLGKELPHPVSVNIAQLTFNVLTSQFDKLELFWKSSLNETSYLPLISLSSTPQIYHDLSAVEESVRIKVDRDIVKNVITTTLNMGISMFEFLVSVSQLLWHLLTGEDKIGLLIDVDTRQHVPALMNVITHCVNYLPVIGSFDKDITIRSFLQSNSAEVRRCVEHGLYPGFLVLENTSEVTAANLCRHNIVMEDITDQLGLGGNDDIVIGKAGPMGTHHETRLLLWACEKNNTLEVQLDYHPGLVTEATAKSFLSDFIGVMKSIVQNQEVFLSDYRSSGPTLSLKDANQLTGPSPTKQKKLHRY
ncbi:uncharacterized protein LOC135466619 [Liolophura sinensis]|uniref:uncharacterized protein LOC135466619 n=1 Tax=Liolophura sinensis TaxID=3198878 RepID=UPI0031593092